MNAELPLYKIDPEFQKLSISLSHEYHISYYTVSKFQQYSQAVDTLRKCFPVCTEKILTGKIKASQDTIIELSKKTDDKIRQILRKAEMTDRIRSIIWNTMMR